MDAKYNTYIVDSVHYAKPGAFANYSGNKVVGVPGMTFNANLGWAPAALNGIRLRAGVQHTGGYFVDDANVVKVPSASVFNGGLVTDRAFAIGGGFGVRGFLTVSNLADTRFVGSAFLNPDRVAGVPVAFEPGLPRQVILSLAFEHLR